MGVTWNKAHQYWQFECDLCHHISPYFRKRGPYPKYCKPCQKIHRKAFTKAWNGKIANINQLTRILTNPLIECKLKLL